MSRVKRGHTFSLCWLILSHVLGGLTALLTGPFQFSSRFRQRHLHVHRTMGRVYLASVAVSGVVVFFVSAIHQKQLQDRQWIFALDTAWLITGAIAFAVILNRNIEGPPSTFLTTKPLCSSMRRSFRLGLAHVTAWIIHFTPESLRSIIYLFANEASEMRTPSPPPSICASSTTRRSDAIVKDPRSTRRSLSQGSNILSDGYLTRRLHILTAGQAE